MLYIIKSYIKARCIYKVGYTSNLKSRLLNYTSHNPGCELTSTREGELLEEAMLHLYLSHKYTKYKSLDEWYFDKDSQIILDFHQDIGKIKKYLWKYRDNIFKIQDFKKNPKNEFPLNKVIYEDLLKDYGKNIRFYDTIDQDKNIIFGNAKNIDKLYYNEFIFKLQNWDDVSLYNELSENFNISDVSLALDMNLELQNFLQEFEKDNNFERKIILYCEFIKKFYDIIKTTDIPGVPQEYKNYMNLFGPDRIRALGSSRGELEREYKVIISGDTRKEIVLNTFQIQQRYTLKEIKEKLREIYQNLGITKNPKASDLEEYYEVKKIKLWDANEKKQNKGYELLELK